MNIWFTLILLAGSGVLGFVFGWLGGFSVRSRTADLRAPAKGRRDERDRELLTPLVRLLDRPARPAARPSARPRGQAVKETDLTRTEGDPSDRADVRIVLEPVTRITSGDVTS